VLVEAGPARSMEQLAAGLTGHGLAIEDLDACLVTHIHLDHAGAAGHLAERGVPIHVHEFGVGHLVDPSKLLSSATRIYGAAMDTLWGETIPAPAAMVHPVLDEQKLEFGPLRFRAVETPGHARHHHAFELDLGFESVCFCGDAAAMLFPGTDFISIPTPPPEFNLPVWKKSIQRLRSGPWTRLHLTHGGTVEATSDHLDRLEDGLEEQVEWIRMWTDSGLDRPEVHLRYRQALLGRARASEIDDRTFDSYASEHLLGMNISGIQRWLGQQGDESGR
tara:strand:- start:6651 stop:7481 length:831 start_codon:yes stop_codon:yes gene_type:complete